jgi:tetratricopeptide (TPR) repeat protein
MVDAIQSDALKITRKVNLLILTADSTMPSGDLEQGTLLYKNAADIARQYKHIGYQTGWIKLRGDKYAWENSCTGLDIIAHCYREMGHYFRMQGRNKEAKQYFFQALDISQNLQSLHVAWSLLLISENEIVRDIHERIELLKNGLTTCTQKDDITLPFAQVIILRELARLHRLTSNYNEASDYLDNVKLINVYTYCLL